MRVYLLCLFLGGAGLGRWADAGDTLIPVQDLKADFHALYQGLQNAHFHLYANMSKTDMDGEFERRLAGIKRPMTDDEARIYFQRFAALGKIAHARIDLPVQAFLAHLEAGGAVFPLDIKARHGAFFITANDSGLTSLQEGDKLVAINGTAMSEWSDRLAAYLSADTEAMLHGFFELQFSFLLWLEVGDAPHFKVTVENRAQKRQTVVVTARDRAFMRGQQQQRQGRLALEGTRSYRMEADQIGYLRPGPFYNFDGSDPWDAAPFKRFIDEAFAALMAQSPRALVIDLRDNPGGDNGFSDYMLAWFADRPFRFYSRFDVKVSEQTTRSNAKRLTPGDTESVSARYARAFAQRKPGDVFAFEIEEATPREGKRFEQPVYVLINRHSYSNAVFVAAIVQDYGFGTVIGEETNDLASSYGSMEQFTLPNTQIAVGYPKSHIVRPNGDATIRGVVPDVLIETPLIETADDPVLRKVLAQVTRASSEPKKPGVKQ